jgi:hypothetical protein
VAALAVWYPYKTMYGKKHMQTKPIQRNELKEADALSPLVSIFSLELAVLKVPIYLGKTLV